MIKNTHRNFINIKWMTSTTPNPTGLSCSFSPLGIVVAQVTSYKEGRQMNLHHQALSQAHQHYNLSSFLYHPQASLNNDEWCIGGNSPLWVGLILQYGTFEHPQLLSKKSVIWWLHSTNSEIIIQIIQKHKSLPVLTMMRPHYALL